MKDERIDALRNAAILTDTQLRFTFAPAKTDKRVLALGKDIRSSQVGSLQMQCSHGLAHLQIKAGFAPERKIELTLPELLLVLELGQRFVDELAAASTAEAFEGEGE